MSIQPELLLHSGRIYTVDTNRPWAEAIAVQNGRIAAVGPDRELLALAGPSTRTIDLGGRLVLPGLCDAHIHFYDWCLSRRQVNLAGYKSKTEMLAQVKEHMARSPRTWLTGRGWNETHWDDGTLPTRGDIDPIAGLDRPALLWRSDMHCAVANSAALALAGINSDSPDPPGGFIGREIDGQPNGLLWELAASQVMACLPVPSEAEIAEALEDGAKELHRLGVTSIHDQRMKDQTEGPVALNAYQLLNRKGRLRLRVNCNIAAHDLNHVSALGLRSGFGDDFLRLGHVKLFADGTMGSRTAWMFESFLGAQTDRSSAIGLSLTPPEQMLQEMRQATSNGFPVSIHAIGDKANQVVLDLFDELAQSAPEPAIPHRLEHVQIIQSADVPRLAELGITASVQPIHVVDDMETADRLLGARAEQTYRFRSLTQSGALLALGSDAPVADPNPFLGIHAAMYRQRPDRLASGPWYGDERLTLEQSLLGYTLGAARAGGWDDVAGTISPGKRADLVVLDRDLFQLAENEDGGPEIADTRVVMTVFDGEVSEY